ncbi:glycosyltransferase family 2 protein [Candidatus Uhrbacteria bacterium]|nr:glycosyltransferase family 2 protein [Candidatus Uhrbacteria bacterium]
MSELRPLDIAVVIPCHQHAAELAKTLAGLSVQTLLPAEVVVVDDASTDGPEGVAASFRDRLPIRSLRFDVNRGAPAARNAGAAATSSPYLLFLDADAELVPDALAAFRDALDAHPDAAFAYADFLWGTKRFRGRPFDVEALRRRNYIHTSSLLRRSAFPGFDGTLRKFQDWDLWLTMAERGATGVWIDRDLFRIEPRKQGMSRWMPRIAYVIPWQKLGFVPKDIANYREAEGIVRRKHGI